VKEPGEGEECEKILCPHAEEEESEEALMAQLGLKLEQELAQLDTGKGLDAKLAVKWGAEETKRESTQWQPIRSMQLTEEQADVATARIVDIEDVEDFLVDLGTHSGLPHCHSDGAGIVPLLVSLIGWAFT